MKKVGSTQSNSSNKTKTSSLGRTEWVGVFDGTSNKPGSLVPDGVVSVVSAVLSREPVESAWSDQMRQLGSIHSASCL